MSDRELNHAPPTGGRDGKGRFTPGNRIGKGRPIGTKVDQLRRKMINSVSVGDIAEIVRVLLRRAKEGDPASIKIIFERLFGQPVQIDILERLEAIEAAQDEREDDE